jgi:hypothetical protein
VGGKGGWVFSLPPAGAMQGDPAGAHRLWRNSGELAASVKKIRLTRDRKWRKMAQKPGIVASKAGIVYVSKRINCCVFTIFDPCADIYFKGKSIIC